MMGRAGVAIVFAAVAAAVLGPWVVPSDPFHQDLALRLAAPTWSHPLGLDELGRDLLARLVLGARVSLFVGVVVVAVSAVVGSIVGAVVLKVRELEYVQAARALGAPVARVLARHVIPATFSTVSVQATLGMAGAVIAEASLSFLGLGVQPPTPSWGSMLDAGRTHLFDAPHLTVVPGVAIALLVMGFNCAGDALRDRLDPRSS